MSRIACAPLPRNSTRCRWRLSYSPGGDTASWILRIFEAEAIRLEGVVRTGIPFGRILGGRFDGLRVVTKSGSFGAETTLDEIAQFLRK